MNKININTNNKNKKNTTKNCQILRLNNRLFYFFRDKLSKENNQEKFHKYTEKLEKSLIKYQMSYSTD